jgi:hypothetical protein
LGRLKRIVAGLLPSIRLRVSWRVAEVEALPGFRLLVRFNDGIIGVVEMAGFIDSDMAGVLAVLRDENLFRQVRVTLAPSPGPANLDLAPDAMYRAINEQGNWIVG